MFDHDTGKTSANPRLIDRSVVDALAEGVVWLSAEGEVLDANAAAAPILGLTHDELTGRNPRPAHWQVVRPDGSAWTREESPALVALRTGQPQRDAIMGITMPGQECRWIIVHAVPTLSAPDQPPSGVVVSFADITPHVELQQHLKATTRELAQLYDQAPCGYHALDTSGRFLRVNATELEWLGITREEAVGRLRPVDFFSEDSKLVFEGNFPRILAGQRLEGLELELIGAHGHRRFVRLTAHPVFDGAGRVTETRSVLHDITDARRQALELARLNAEQAAALDNDLVSIVRLRDRRVLWTNRAFDRIFGYAAGELMGRTTEVLFPDRTAFERFGTAVYPQLRDGGSYRGVLELRRKDGSVVWSDSSGTMLDPQTGEVMWISLDVTEQRRVEQLRLKAARLEAQNEQLLETQRLHQLFLDNMSHELRTPLNAVIGFADLLKLYGPMIEPEKQRHYVEQIAEGGRRLLDLVRSLLTTVDVEAGRLVLHRESTDLGQLVREAATLMSHTASARRVAIEVSVCAGVGEVQVDPLRLRQVLAHLLGNAIKFSHDGGRVGLRVLPERDDAVRIEVKDQGIGIPEHELPRLFSKFHQVSTGSTKAYPGAGIGLALVKMLVEAHGGTVGVLSTLGEGSAFQVVIPKTHGD